MSQTYKNNTQAQEPTIKIIDQYKDLFVLRERPVSEVFIERLCADLVQWAITDDEALKLVQFIHSRNMSSYTFYAWIKKFPMLKQAKDVALEAIGCRREIGALKNKLNVNMVMSQMAKYDSSWMKLEVKRAELRAKTQHKIDPDVKYAIVVEDFSKDGDKTNNLPDTESR